MREFKDKTCIVMSDTRTPTGAVNEYYSLTAYVNYKYAQLHGYDFIYYRPYLKTISDDPMQCCINPNTGKPRHASWAKLIPVYHTLKKYKRVVYIDTDAMFNNLQSVDKFLAKYDTQDKQVMFLSDYPFSESAPNAGFFICNHSLQSLMFIRSWFCDQHFDPLFDRESPWEQAAISYWNLINTTLLPYYTTLPVSQFKWKNFKSGYSFQQNLPTNTASHYLAGNRPLIDHYLMKKSAEILEDVKELYDMSDFTEISKVIASQIIYLDTDNYQF